MRSVIPCYYLYNIKYCLSVVGRGNSRMSYYLYIYMYTCVYIYDTILCYGIINLERGTGYHGG